MVEEIVPGLLSWASILEEKTREQAITTAGLPFVKPHLALMPDAHWGMGSTVGSVIPTRGVVMPAAVGVDIGCGMSATRTNLVVSDFPTGALSRIRDAIIREVPVGKGEYRTLLTRTGQERIHQLDILAASDDVNLFRFGPNWRSQLGTLGGGNHFIEVCADEEDHVWVFLHSGSRGVGNKIAMHHVKVAKAECARWHVALPHPDLAYLPQGDPKFWRYIRDLRWAQAFAAENRAEMVDRVIFCLNEEFDGGVTREEVITCHHNYTERETHYGEKLWITRKGAINAEEGRRGLIPGSMGTHSYVVTGKGDKASFNSAPHGAGRNFSRTEARRRFTGQDLADAMKGIEWREDMAAELVDEIPAAYKSIDVVMRDASGLVQVDHELRQLLNVKGS